MEEVNAILGYKQISNILTTIRYIENNDKRTQKMQNIKNNNLKRCVEWCKENNIPYNNYSQNLSYGEHSNIFISKN